MRSAFSHDLRTPLSVLKGYVEYLKRYYPKGKLSQEKVLETLDDLSEQTRRLEDFSNHLSQKKFNIDMNIYLEIVENAAANAMRYAENSVKLEIWDEQGWLKFMIYDDGPGFSNEELKKATRLYFHGKSTEDCLQQAKRRNLSLFHAQTI